MQPDLRAECLAMAERLKPYPTNTTEEATALLRRVAGALPQEPQGDVVEAAAEAAYLADDHPLGWPWDDVAETPAGQKLIFMIRAALSAAEPFIQARIAAAVEDGGWQPIETAPKDGTPILVYLGGPTDQYVVAWDCCDPGNWREIYGDQDAIFHPTHWRPLPDPPARATIQDKPEGGE